MDNKYSIINFNDNEILINKLVELWNHEVGFIFPFSLKMFKQKTTLCKFIDYNSSFVALDGDEVVGFIISKIYDNNEIMSKYINKAWISLFYVSRKRRREGIGSTLLSLCEGKLKSLNIQEILFGADYDNFFPGIPCDFDNLTQGFLEKRGYNCGRYTHDLICDLKKHEIINDNSFNIRYANKKDREVVLDFFSKYFYGRWYYEALEYFDSEDIKEEYLLSFEGDVMTGFLRVNKQLIEKISYNINWSKRFEKLIGIGPLGVRPDFRKRGIARALINRSLDDGVKEGFSEAMIDWTGLMEIYQKNGFEVWKCYQYSSKKILK